MVLLTSDMYSCSPSILFTFSRPQLSFLRCFPKRTRTSYTSHKQHQRTAESTMEGIAFCSTSGRDQSNDLCSGKFILSFFFFFFPELCQCTPYCVHGLPVYAVWHNAARVFRIVDALLIHFPSFRFSVFWMVTQCNCTNVML